MKKILAPVFLLLAAGFFAFPTGVRAGGPAGALLEFSPSPSSAPADGQTAITVTVHSYDYKCSNPDGYGQYYHTLDPSYCTNYGYGTATKEDVSLSNLSANVSGSDNIVSPSTFATDSSGHGSFTVKSTVAEAKTATVVLSGSSYEYGHTTVTFTSPTPAPAPAAAPKKTTTTPTPTPAPAAAPAAPAAPILTVVQADSKQIDTTGTITLDQSKPLVLSGTTVPNGVVTLTIHSTPKTATTTADKDGHWTYTISGLESGDHYVEATVTDPTTNKTSDPAKLVAFTLTATPKVSAKTLDTAPKKQSHMALIIGLLAGALVLGAAGGYFWYKARKKKQMSQQQGPAPTPPTSPDQSSTI